MKFHFGKLDLKLRILINLLKILYDGTNAMPKHNIQMNCKLKMYEHFIF